MRLEKRICKCGCGSCFDCDENSGRRYLNKSHIYAESSQHRYVESFTRHKSIITSDEHKEYNNFNILGIMLKDISRLFSRFKDEKAR